LDYTPWITGAAQPKLTQERLLAIAVAVAPLDEQEAIVRHIDMETQPIVAAIVRLQAELGLLGEYRLRLISDVVTGKLDVRRVATHLPPVDSGATSLDAADQMPSDLEDTLP